MSPEFYYFTMLSFLFTHELDATRKHEWRMFPFIDLFSEKLAGQLYIWLHIPLFLAILWFTGSNPNSGIGQIISVFSIVHIGLHLYFWNHPLNEFKTLSSWLLILAAGLFGALHLSSIN